MRRNKVKKQTHVQEFERLHAHIPADGKLAPVRPLKKSTPRWKKILKRTILILLAIVLLTGLYVGGKFVYNGVKLFGWDGFWSLFTTRELKGEATGRVNFLLAGNSSDQEGHGGAELTDSIMLVSINTRDNTGYMLSIPRDLYVDIPDYGPAKINEAYQAGEKANFDEPGYAEGGMGLLQKVVGERFGVKLHYYALVNYTALEEAVNAVGGIDVVIESTDERGLFDPSRDLTNGQPLVNLPNGKVSLTGHEALNLARARGNSYGSYGYGLSDFTRTEHQRKIIAALTDKITSLKSLSNPITLGKLFDTLGGNVQTDMTMGEARRLYNIMREIPSSSMVSVGLNDVNDKNLLQSYTTPSGQSALIPAAGFDNFGEIQKYLRSIK